MKLLIAWFRTYRLTALLIAVLLLLFPLTHVLGGGQMRELSYALTLCGAL